MPNSAHTQTIHGVDDSERSLGEEGSLPSLHLADRLLSSPGDDVFVADRNAADRVALVGAARWAKEFLTNPHPELGRSGHVCPYVNAAIREQRFLLTVLRNAHSKQRAVEQDILRLGRHLEQLHPKASRKAHLSTIVVLFPDLPKERAGEIINDVHRRLKPSFLSRGMMLGEFFAESSKPGLHNPDFRPLRSEVPLLVIRSMMLTDIAFLSDRARFVRAFIENFGARGCAEVRSYLERSRDNLSDAQVRLLLERVARFESGERQRQEVRTNGTPWHLQQRGEDMS